MYISGTHQEKTAMICQLQRLHHNMTSHRLTAWNYVWEFLLQSDELEIIVVVIHYHLHMVHALSSYVPTQWGLTLCHEMLNVNCHALNFWRFIPHTARQNMVNKKEIIAKHCSSSTTASEWMLNKSGLFYIFLHRSPIC